MTLRRSSRRTPPWMTATASGWPSSDADALGQVFQRVAVLGEDDDLAEAAPSLSRISVLSDSRSRSSVHFRSVPERRTRRASSSRSASRAIS